jgi:RNA polymerase sigma factor (sigma-70 family)
VSTYGTTQVERRRPKPKQERDVATLVRSAAEGDQEAWAALVERFSGLVWSVTRGFRLSHHDAAEVSQTTWLQLVEHLGDIREPERVGAWLATTTRRQCLTTLRKTGRALPVDLDDGYLISPDSTAELDTALDAGQRRAALSRALDDLPEPGKALLRLLSSDPAPSYAEAAAALDMPIGSIGPTRARCLERLRRSPELVGLSA